MIQRVSLYLLSLTFSVASAQDPGQPARDATGRALNLDFETGDLRDWTATGNAFSDSPIEGDTVTPRRPGMKSNHQGRYWVGTYERGGDVRKGTLTSVPFKVMHTFASFLVGGGHWPQTRVEIVLRHNNEIVFTTSGDNREDMERCVVDLFSYRGQEIFIRLVDEHSGAWGHLNFDDFRFHDRRPAFALRRRAPPPDVFQHHGLSPEAAAKAMTVPPGFEVKLFAAEPDIKNPIAMAIDDRGRIWVIENLTYPIRRKGDKGDDRILIFEDTDGDGKADKRTVFYEGLNHATGLELGFGGVWVGAAPYLYFIPDKNADDKPDADPQVLLDGWGFHDPHETLNSFIWGPDGWLYGCHGVFTFSRVGKPGTPNAERIPINAGIWRYHPTKHKFEDFAEGTSNPWGIDFDEHGQAFITACVIPHLYHVFPGGRFTRQAGSHFNPFTYDDIKTIAKHRHWIGDSPHGGNGRSDEAGGGHAHAGCMIYQGGSWPKEYHGKLFMNNIHGARINVDSLTPKGSGYVGDRAPDFLKTNDSYSQIINLQYGPDGNVFMIDWYDPQQCHTMKPGDHDRKTGRIFKVVWKDAKPVKVDISKANDWELMGNISNNKNKWIVRHSIRRLLERENATKDVSTRDKWNDPVVELAFTFSDDPRKRGRIVRQVTANGVISAENADQLGIWARNGTSPVVRLELASGCQRLPEKQRWDILAGLLSHLEDATDHNLPLMYWYAAEPLAAVDASRALDLAANGKIPLLKTYMVRRVAALGTPEAFALLVKALDENKMPAGIILDGLNEALKGQRRIAMPAQWPAVYRKLAANNDDQVRSAATALAVTFGDPRAFAAMREVVANPDRNLRLRTQALRSLLGAKDPEIVPVLHKLLAESGLRRQALQGLGAYNHPDTPRAIIDVFGMLSPDEKRDALNALAGRPAYAKEMLAAIGAKKIAAVEVSADIVRQLKNLQSAEIDKQIADVWGTARETSADKAKIIASFKNRLSAPAKQKPDLHLGRAVYAKTCQQCHKLFGVGTDNGPELTGSNRAQLDYVLQNVLDPNALIGKDYIAHRILMADGRVLTALIKKQDEKTLTVITANETLVLPRSEIEQMKTSDQSLMPENQLEKMPEHEIRSLIAYLASPTQVPMLATKENLATFFSGRDLVGWEGDSKLWSVENGEIVGKSPGLKHNTFLVGPLVCDDFRFTCEVKLTPNAGNSGIQFRSQALPGGEVKGYQADVGVGWWGKLYEEHGRGLLWDRSGERHVKTDDWNRYEIVAAGSRLRTFINGQPCVDLDDPPGARRGVFAFQLHSGGPFEVRYRNLKLELSGSSNGLANAPKMIGD